MVAPDKGAKKHKNQAENELDAKQNNNKTANVPTVTNVNGNRNQTTSQQEAHTWKKGTVLIMGDSMLYGIDEKKISKNGTVKVRCFSGSTITDLQKFYMQPLLTKKPSKVILHVGTNDAVNKEATADKILDALLDLKKEIETTLPECTVVLSTPMKRMDNGAAGKIIEALNKKILSLGLNIVNNENISANDIGRRGLHLNNRGVSKFASNLVAKLQNL